MKVTVLQENLARGLGIVAKAVSPRSTLPVLANVLIASDEGRLRLSATNLEMGITCWIPARIDEEGSTTVPARTFSDLVATLPVDQVLLKLDVPTQTLNVRGGTSTNDIKCIDAQEFPPLPVPDFEGAVQINVGDFREMIHQVVFAASSDDARCRWIQTLCPKSGSFHAFSGFRFGNCPGPGPQRTGARRNGCRRADL